MKGSAQPFPRGPHEPSELHAGARAAPRSPDNAEAAAHFCRIGRLKAGGPRRDVGAVDGNKHRDLTLTGHGLVVRSVP